MLRKGETIDKGNIQIKVVEIIPGNLCDDAGSVQYQTRVRIQFIRLSDEKVMCEEVFPETGSALLSAQACGSSDISALSDAGIEAIYVRAVNVKDGWAFFELRG